MDMLQRLCDPFWEIGPFAELYRAVLVIYVSLSLPQRLELLVLR